MNASKVKVPSCVIAANMPEPRVEKPPDVLFSDIFVAKYSSIYYYKQYVREKLVFASQA